MGNQIACKIMATFTQSSSIMKLYVNRCLGGGWGGVGISIQANEVHRLI